MQKPQLELFFLEHEMLALKPQNATEKKNKKTARYCTICRRKTSDKVTKTLPGVKDATEHRSCILRHVTPAVRSLIAHAFSAVSGKQTSHASLAQNLLASGRPAVGVTVRCAS